jgi:hypothetical protein
MTVEGETDQNHKRDTENDECLFFCRLDKARKKQYELNDKQDFYDAVERGESSHHIDLEEKADHEEVIDRNFTFRGESKELFKFVHPDSLQTCVGFNSLGFYKLYQGGKGCQILKKNISFNFLSPLSD